MADRTGRRTSFSIEQANAALPLVRAIVADYTELACEIDDRRRHLEFLLQRHSPDVRDPYHEELLQVQRDLHKDVRRLKDYVRELRELGLEPAEDQPGFVHFPSKLDGRRITLCWKLGEPEVHYWHETYADCHQREELPAMVDTAESR